MPDLLNPQSRCLAQLMLVFAWLGASPVHAADSYDPASGRLTIPYVYAGKAMYSNVLVTVKAVNSMGSFHPSRPFDSYDGTTLAIPSVSVPGGATYRNVSVSIGDVLSVGGSLNAGPGSFTTAANPVVARSYDTATLLPDGTVLVVGGQNPGQMGSNSVSSVATLYDPTSNSWSSTGTLLTGRAGHTATLLPNGRVLVVGGSPSGFFPDNLASAEQYIPSNHIWWPAGSLITARSGHMATLLSNGKVLVVGGDAPHASAAASGVVQLASAELYDPASDTWSAAGSLSTARDGHTATLLPNGKVLVVGGEISTPPSGIRLASAELYDPASNTWSAAASLFTARAGHTATLLPNGKVLVVGGADGYDVRSSAELYDPASDSWSAAGSLLTARYGHTATLLPNGKVLVAGGYGAIPTGFLSRAELYDPATNTWSATGSLDGMSLLNTATLLPNGKVLLEGTRQDGVSTLANAELYW